MAEFALERIYVKDLSFESPRAPEIFKGQWQPAMQLDINSKATALGDDRFEVVLTVTVNVRGADQVPVAIVEVQQGGLFRIKDLSDSDRARLLATGCPTILFPYVREVIDSMMARGGLPVVNLAPVNFDALFEEAVKRRAAGQSKGDAEQPSISSPKGSIEH